MSIIVVRLLCIIFIAALGGYSLAAENWFNVGLDAVIDTLFVFMFLRFDLRWIYDAAADATRRKIYNLRPPDDRP